MFLSLWLSRKWEGWACIFVRNYIVFKRFCCLFPAEEGLGKKERDACSETRKKIKFYTVTKVQLVQSEIRRWFHMGMEKKEKQNEEFLSSWEIRQLHQ